MLMKQEKNRQMDNLKSEYESIPVPKEAKERMLAGIAQAKKEQKGVIIMKFAKKTGGAAAAAMIAITVRPTPHRPWPMPWNRFRSLDPSQRW